MADPRAVLFDIDGVLVVSWAALPGAVETVRRVRAAGHPVRFLTNTTSRTRAGIGAALRAAGFEVADDEVLTATAATAAHLWVAHPGGRCLVLNSGDVSADLDGIDVVEASQLGEDASGVDVVVIGGAGPEFGYDAVNLAFRAVLGGASLVAMHRNTQWRTDTGLRLDAGAYVAALEAATGAVATVVGKPAPAMFEAGLAAVGAEPADTVMVGDDLDSDVRGAQLLGITGVQVRTGKFDPSQLDDGGVAPDVVLDSVADLPSWLGVV